jgi:hypothetical protein
MNGHQTFATLRTCTDCRWVFTVEDEDHTECPKCGGQSKGARNTYGSAAYTYKRTQHPWIKYKVDGYRALLQRQVAELNQRQEKK